MPVDHCALHDSQKSFAFANFVGDIDLEMIMGRGRASRCAMRVVLKEHIGGAKKLFSYPLFNQSSETRYRRPSLFHHSLVSFFSFSFHWPYHTLSHLLREWHNPSHSSKHDLSPNLQIISSLSSSPNLDLDSLCLLSLPKHQDMRHDMTKTT